VDLSEFVGKYPRLWHMAEVENWPLIQLHGLLSTSALLDLFEYKGSARNLIEASFRAESVEIEHHHLGQAVIRDQRPMISDSVVARYLDGLSPADWYRTLNSRVFFWVREQRLERLLAAGLYRERPHMVLVLDTARLLEQYLDQVTLSPINSGAIFPAGKARRGPQTFHRFDAYPWSERAKQPEPVVELAVDHAVLGVTDFIVEASERQAPPKK
jgi:Family of unknown function (DUF7002)